MSTRGMRMAAVLAAPVAAVVAGGAPATAAERGTDHTRISTCSPTPGGLTACIDANTRYHVNATPSGLQNYVTHTDVTERLLDPDGNEIVSRSQTVKGHLLFDGSETKVATSKVDGLFTSASGTCTWDLGWHLSNGELRWHHAELVCN